jgi:hypothetical protein
VNPAGILLAQIEKQNHEKTFSLVSALRISGVMV